MTGSKISFSKPPISEVVYSFQFEPLSNYHLGYAGLLWGEYRKDYPLVEQDAPLKHEIERFGTVPKAPQPKFEFVQKLPQPRLRMISKDRGLLLQLQNDRFVFNWRNFHDPDREYPRFDNLRKIFQKELDKFENFVLSNELGDLGYNQVEVTNVNHIPTNNREFSDVFKGLECGVDISPELEPETFLFQLKQKIYLDSKPIGRLYTAIEKANLISDRTQIFKLTFTARGHPKNPTRESSIELLELLRDHINNAFLKLTTDQMHKEWGKK